MRIPSTKVYRAFPELDRFSDEQCRRFAAAARGSIWRRLRHRSLEFAIALIVLGLVVGAVYAVDEWWPPELALKLMFGWRAELVRDALVLIFGFGSPTLAFLLVRDRMVRRSIRRVINTRGSCGVCGYGLTSLIVPDTNMVRCPECGHEVPVDESLGEIAVDSDGVRRYLPSPNLVGTIKWLTPRRKKWLLRIAIGGPIAAIVLIGGFWGAYELFLARQARAAMLLRANPAAIEARIATFQPGPPEAPDAWAAFYEATTKIARLDVSWQSARQPGDVSVPDFSTVAYPLYGGMQPGLVKDSDLTKLAKTMIEKYREAGVYQSLDKMAASPRASRVISWPPPSQPLLNTFSPDGSQSRNLARINNARMRGAVLAGDLAEFVSAFGAERAMVRMLRMSPLQLDHYVAAAIEWLDFSTIQATLALQPGREWADAIDKVMKEQAGGLPIRELLWATRTTSLDFLGTIYRDPANVRFGVLSPPLRYILPSGTTRDPRQERLGSLRENVSWLNAEFDAFDEASDHDPFERTPYRRLPTPGVVADFFTPHLRLMIMIDSTTMVSRATRNLTALERYRDAHGDYPETLSELVPAQIDALPIDPWSGRPFGYRKLERGSLGVARFVLYSIGGDFTDNSGAPCGENGAWSLLSGQASGCDFLLNLDEERDESKGHAVYNATPK